MKMKVLDTFAGAGGFSLGFELAGFDIIGAIESDLWACETFQFNHPKAKIINSDIQNLPSEQLLAEFKDNMPDIILGGPPCQGFSICNKNSGDEKDPRNSLFREFLRIGKLFQPKFLIMENVPNITNAKTNSKEYVIDIIKNELQQIGYNVYDSILSATDFGIPQIRKRYIIIASKNLLSNPFPKPTHYVKNGENTTLLFTNELQICPTLWQSISDLPELKAGDRCEGLDYIKEPENDYQLLMRNKSKKIYNHIAMNHSKRVVERFASMSCGDTISDVPEHLRPLKRNGFGEISEKLYDQNNRRMHPYKPCHTIAASFYANFVHPFQDRNFTPREGARIQSFPDWYVFKGKPTVVSHKLLQREGRLEEKYLCQYNQIGNAVPPLLAKAIAENIKNQLNS